MVNLALGELKFTESPDIGYVCLWVLKNSSYPDYVAHTQSGAMCLSFHHDFGYLLAVGLRDGNLAVYNVSLLKNEPQYSTNSAGTKLMASVMQVYKTGFYKLSFFYLYNYTLDTSDKSIKFKCHPGSLVQELAYW